MDRKRTSNKEARPGGWVLGVLVVGALVWTVIVIVVLLVLRGKDDAGSLRESPTAIMALPTLGAATSTAAPTATVAATAEATVAATASATATETPPAAASHTASPAAAASADPAPAAQGAVEPTLPPVPIITLAVSAVAPSPGPSSTVAPSLTATPAPTETPSPTGTLPPAPTLPPSATATLECVPPAGWETHSVQAGETLFAYVLGAEQPGLTVEDLLAANCLSSRFLRVGQVLYLPAGAAENAPSSDPFVAPAEVGGPRPGTCPCTISVAAGWRREQIADAITRSGTTFSGADFLAVTGPGVSTPFEFVNARPAGVSMEGYLFPGAYTVGNETTAEQFRDMLLAAFGGAISDQVRADAAGQGVTFHQALTMASIIQRETAGAELEGLVASVYYNRLRDGTPLGATVTVQYALGAPGAWWPRVRSVDVASPYNTYNVAGLPPGPISNPGASAIMAAVYPPATNYRFHTASCSGAGEVFAETYEEHLRNVNCGE